MRLSSIVMLASLLVLLCGNAGAAELTRVYHNGKPNGSLPSTVFTSAMGSVSGYDNSGDGRVWVSSNDGYADQYSNWGIVSSRRTVSDYVRSSTGSRGITGTTSSALSVRFFSSRW